MHYIIIIQGSKVWYLYQSIFKPLIHLKISPKIELNCSSGLSLENPALTPLLASWFALGGFYVDSNPNLLSRLMHKSDCDPLIFLGPSMAMLKVIDIVLEIV